jgi:dehydrogenase/reductase SDR family protein 12
MVLERQQSADGLDSNFATNTLGTFAITAALEPVLSRCAPAKVITVTSGGMYTEPLDVDDMQNAGMKSYDGTKAYARDKRRQVGPPCRAVGLPCLPCRACRAVPPCCSFMHHGM